MANSKATKSAFSSTNQPKNKRGKSTQTKMLEAIKRVTGMDEAQFLDHLANQAILGSDMNLYKEVLLRATPQKKATQETIEFDLDPTHSPYQKADSVVQAIADGAIPPDVGVQIIQAINTSIEIKEKSELQERLERIEELLAQNNFRKE